MPETLRIVTVGEVPATVLRPIVGAITAATGLRQSLPQLSISDEEAWDARRNQLDTRLILPRLEEIANESGSLVLGVSARDLFSTVFTFVFGEAHLESTAAIVSLYRLIPEAYGLPSDPLLLQERGAKEALHEVGHLFGLVHCDAPRCVMGFSANVAEIDSKFLDYCDDCLDHIVRVRNSPRGEVLPRHPT